MSGELAYLVLPPYHGASVAVVDLRTGRELGRVDPDAEPIDEPRSAGCS